MQIEKKRDYWIEHPVPISEMIKDLTMDIADIHRKGINFNSLKSELFEISQAAQILFESSSITERDKGSLSVIIRMVEEAIHIIAVFRRAYV
jgi:hypothetical protein